MIAQSGSILIHNLFWIDFKGFSMFPLLQEGDEVLIEENKNLPFAKGDVVLFFDKENHELILHRLLNTSNKTKGDYSCVLDRNDHQIFIGKAKGVYREGFYRDLPGSNSLFNYLFVFFSKLRLQGSIKRKLSLIFFWVLVKIFEFYSGKTNLNHKSMIQENDL